VAAGNILLSNAGTLRWVNSNNLGNGGFYYGGTNTFSFNYWNGSASTVALILSSGNVGIGTTTPYSKLTIWGIDTASSTLSFNVVNNASTTLFAVFDGGN